MRLNEEIVMISMRKNILSLVVLSALSVVPVSSMNLLQPYNVLLRPGYNAKHCFQISMYAETSVADRGYANCRVNPLQIWNRTQDALSMLDGFNAATPIGQKRIEVDAEDDGVRGHFCVTGKLETPFAGAAVVRSFFRNNLALSAYLPFYVMRLRNVCWRDLTGTASDDDLRVRDYLTDHLFENVYELGDGLSLGNWKRQGVGDLTFMIDWFNDFEQRKPLLKNVRINWWLGLTLPTGLRQDEDKIMAVPFGTDGSVALPFGLGLDLSFVFNARVGFDVQLIHTFGNTRTRRIQTAQNQTEFLFLQKASVYKDYGLNQQFSLYGQLYKLFKGASLMLAYQFTKQGDTSIALKCETLFSNAIANASENLKDWTLHQIFIRGDYDFGAHLNDDVPVVPRLELYARIPFNGKRAVANTMLGANFAIDF